MIVRELKDTDYKSIKPLYENTEYQWLWMDEETSQTEEITFDEETKAQLEKIFSYTKKLHQRLQKNQKTYKIFVIEKDNQLIGFVALNRYPQKYQITEWGMLDSHDEEAKEEILNFLERQDFIETLSVVTTSRNATEWLRNHGFISKGAFHKKILRKIIKIKEMGL